MGGGKCYDEEENLNLVRAYSSVSENPTKGTSQRKDAFWDEVASTFKHFMEEGIRAKPNQKEEDVASALAIFHAKGRDKERLQYHFKILKRYMVSYHSIYTRICDVAPSGTTKEDWERAAISEFEAKKSNGKFMYHKVYEFMCTKALFGAMSSKSGSSKEASKLASEIASGDVLVMNSSGGSSSRPLLSKEGSTASKKRASLAKDASAKRKSSSNIEMPAMPQRPKGAKAYKKRNIETEDDVGKAMLEMVEEKKLRRDILQKEVDIRARNNLEKKALLLLKDPYVDSPTKREVAALLCKDTISQLRALSQKKASVVSEEDIVDNCEEEQAEGSEEDGDKEEAENIDETEMRNLLQDPFEPDVDIMPLPGFAKTN